MLWWTVSLICHKDLLSKPPGSGQAEEPRDGRPVGKCSSGLCDGEADESSPHTSLPQVWYHHHHHNCVYYIMHVFVSFRKWIELNGTASQKAIVVSGAPKSAPGWKDESMLMLILMPMLMLMSMLMLVSMLMSMLMSLLPSQPQVRRRSHHHYHHVSDFPSSSWSSSSGGKEEPSKPEKPKPMFPVYNRSHGNFMNEYELPK